MTASSVAGSRSASRYSTMETQVRARTQDGVYGWALAGVVMCCVSSPSWIRWMLSDGFVQPDPGPDSYAYLGVFRLTERVSISRSFFLVRYVLLRPADRERRITLG